MIIDLDKWVISPQYSPPGPRGHRGYAVITGCITSTCGHARSSAEGWEVECDVGLLVVLRQFVGRRAVASCHFKTIWRSRGSTWASFLSSQGRGFRGSIGSGGGPAHVYCSFLSIFLYVNDALSLFMVSCHACLPLCVWLYDLLLHLAVFSLPVVIHLLS